MKVSTELDSAIDGYFSALQELCDVLSKENGFKNRLQVFGELSIVTNTAMHQLVEKGWGGKPNTRHGEKESK